MKSAERRGDPPRDGLLQRVSRGKWGLTAGAIGALVGAGAVALWAGIGSSSPERAQTEKIVRDYILANPDIIPEAMGRLQDRETAEIVAANRAAYETPYAGAWAGAADGDVVLVEFFDYACGYCRKSNADVERLLAEDKRLKVVWRDWPVLGPDSEAAAAASLTAAEQGRFRPFFAQLFASGRPTATALARVKQATGIGESAGTEVAARDELAKNQDLARAVNATGTPTFIVGERTLQGAVGYGALKAAIAEARAKG